MDGGNIIYFRVHQELFPEADRADTIQKYSPENKREAVAFSKERLEANKAVFTYNLTQNANMGCFLYRALLRDPEVTLHVRAHFEGQQGRPKKPSLASVRGQNCNLSCPDSAQGQPDGLYC